jgi:hypothetical protein
MMVNTSVYRLNGKTYTLSLTTSASSALLITPKSNDQTNYVHLLNTGTFVAAIELSNGATFADPAIAAPGAAGSYILPAAMNYPIVIACPAGPLYIKGISSGTNVLYITPCLAD